VESCPEKTASLGEEVPGCVEAETVAEKTARMSLRKPPMARAFSCGCGVWGGGCGVWGLGFGDWGLGVGG
jgi:hypothetical protein